MLNICFREMKQRTGLFTADVDALVDAKLARFFMPHGLGHQLGLDVHDVGGYVPGERKDPKDLSLVGLRLGRSLKSNMVLTVEPGFYFVYYLLDELMSDPARAGMVDVAVLNRLRAVGGVRIEDNVVIREGGCDVLSDVPRDVSDVELVMRGEKDWIPGQQCRAYRNGNLSRSSEQDDSGSSSKKRKITK
jgi:Xaa-Pro dipeptidase